MAARSSAAILSSAMRVRRPTKASASVFPLATISSASCRARSSRASRSLSADAALASYSAFSASASFRSDSASASWSRIRAILLSSALPIAPGTFFQIMTAKTTSIASATQPPGFRPKKVGSASPIHFRLHGSGGFLAVDFEAGQLLDHLTSRFSSDPFDLRTGGRKGLADLCFRGLDLQVQFVHCNLDLLL